MRLLTVEKFDRLLFLKNVKTFLRMAKPPFTKGELKFVEVINFYRSRTPTERICQRAVSACFLLSPLLRLIAGYQTALSYQCDSQQGRFKWQRD